MNCISENQEIKNIWFNGIRVNDLEHIIKKIDEEGNILENLHKYGLPKNINKEALIALCCKNDNPRRTHFHEFKPLNKNFIKFNINNCKYDIPFYIIILLQLVFTDPYSAGHIHDAIHALIPHLHKGFHQLMKSGNCL